MSQQTCTTCGHTGNTKMVVEEKKIRFIGVTYNSPTFLCPNCGTQKNANWLFK